jgi:hypothetical protein
MRLHKVSKSEFKATALEYFRLVNSGVSVIVTDLPAESCTLDLTARQVRQIPSLK